MEHSIPTRDRPVVPCGKVQPSEKGLPKRRFGKRAQSLESKAVCQLTESRADRFPESGDKSLWSSIEGTGTKRRAVPAPEIFDHTSAGALARSLSACERTESGGRTRGTGETPYRDLASTGSGGPGRLGFEGPLSSGQEVNPNKIRHSV